jgi:hypothetical protein
MKPILGPTPFLLQRGVYYGEPISLRNTVVVAFTELA